MSRPGGAEEVDPVLVRARTVLLDALDALVDQRDAVIVVGAQAVYLRTGGVDVAIPESTSDGDLALAPGLLVDDPLLEQAMRQAGFLPAVGDAIGTWTSGDGIPVDLMVPRSMDRAESPRIRGARIPPHGPRAARRVRGLEAVVVDSSTMDVSALDPADRRTVAVKVAGPAALVVAKLHKIAERAGAPHRLDDKDAHDLYRVLLAIDTGELAAAMSVLLADERSVEVTREAMTNLQELFAAGPSALGAVMVGRAEGGFGDPEVASQAASLLAADLLRRIGRPQGA